LYSGYLDKRNPINGSYNKRFVVLTHDAVHWFKRTDNHDLLGAERGHIKLEDIMAVRIVEEDATTFEISTNEATRRYFRGASPNVCEEWVSAVRSATKGIGGARKGKKGAGGWGGDGDMSEKDAGVEVVALLVSLKSKADHTELVIARNPAWNRIVYIPNVRKGDELIISTSNGGFVSLSHETMVAKAEDGMDFETAVQSVPLAQSLRLTVNRNAPDESSLLDGPRPSPASPQLNHTSSHSSSTSSSRGSSGKASASASAAKKTLVSRAKKMVAFVATLTTDRDSTVTLVLSCMVLLVGLTSLPYLGPDTSLLLVFSLLAAAHSLYRLAAVDCAQDQGQGQSGSGGSCVMERLGLRAGGGPSARGVTLTVTLHGHAFTSPDAPINEPEDKIPQRFIDGCEGDMKEARRRWEITKHWREAEVSTYHNVGTISQSVCMPLLVMLYNSIVWLSQI
jgi:hypothetical protein